MPALGAALISSLNTKMLIEEGLRKPWGVCALKFYVSGNSLGQWQND